MSYGFKTKKIAIFKRRHKIKGRKPGSSQKPDEAKNRAGWFFMPSLKTKVKVTPSIGYHFLLDMKHQPKQVEV